jgi:Fe-S oxidoreductase
MTDKKVVVPIMSDLAAAGKEPDMLFWVGCAGSFDDRAKKVTVALTKILNAVGINFAILGNEERCSGDPARRAGNEFLFQMTAQQNVMTLQMYNVKKIVTACPHCYNILKNEYPILGLNNVEVIHHSQLLQQIINEGKLKVEGGAFQGKSITYHDSCFLGRANGIYEAPRTVLEQLDANLNEMKRSKSNGLCCGAGGAQMFKEDEKGDKRINDERAAEVIGTGAEVVAANCPFCITMLQDGLKPENDKRQSPIMVLDLSEMIVQSNKY